MRQERIARKPAPRRPRPVDVEALPTALVTDTTTTTEDVLSRIDDLLERR